MRVRFQAFGRWELQDVLARWVQDNRPRHPEIEAAIDDAWHSAQSRPGLKIFDGPMCRLENLSAGLKLELNLSPTSYKTFWGTNLHNSQFSRKYGSQALANPVGLSCALESADGYLLLGRRNASVAYYPSRVHPFAGTLEPADPIDIFAGIRRELSEELDLKAGDLVKLLCIAVIQDTSIGQPELIFSAKSALTRGQIEENLDADEHESLVAIEAAPQKVELLLDDAAFTPVARGTVLLWGREHFGPHWFDAAERAVNLRQS